MVAAATTTKRTNAHVLCVALTWSFLLWTSHHVLALSSSVNKNHKFVVLGGTGKIGTAAAAHLIERRPGCQVVLVGRRRPQRRQRPATAAVDGGHNDAAVKSIEELLRPETKRRQVRPDVSYRYVADIWDPRSLKAVLTDDVSCVIHAAGPYSDRSPTVLDAVLEAHIPVYVDVSDPLPFLEASIDRSCEAVASRTTALIAAGAFPGMSNVLAVEAARAATNRYSDATGQDVTIKDVRFNYFTKGLGGSGTVNLEITNAGFGDVMVQHNEGKRTAFTGLSGKLLGTVDFFIDRPGPSGTSCNLSDTKQRENDEAKRRVGTQKVFAWPFPEAATVATKLSIAGSSSAAMGTAPDVWNDMLGSLVSIVPRPWWRSKAFSKFMADFSRPLMLLTDKIMKEVAPPGDCGETHAMRIDVTVEETNQNKYPPTTKMVSIVQAHDSFRRCVGQSCAEFALDLLDQSTTASPRWGVFLPEQYYSDPTDRKRIIDNLTSTPGTFCYTGPVHIFDENDLPVYPTRVREIVSKST
jgi:saccharopine dehydrogenase-like NADP-dependent oxidoreductase